MVREIAVSGWRNAVDAAEAMGEVGDVGVAALMGNCRDREIGTGKHCFRSGAPKLLKCDGGTHTKGLPKQPVHITAGYVGSGGQLCDSDACQGQLRPCSLQMCNHLA